MEQKEVITLKDLRQSHKEDLAAVVLSLRLTLLQQNKERKYIKQKPYSHTLTEQLYQRLTQYTLL